jgi:hypothetical protein
LRCLISAGLLGVPGVESVGKKTKPRGKVQKAPIRFSGKRVSPSYWVLTNSRSKILSHANSPSLPREGLQRRIADLRREKSPTPYQRPGRPKGSGELDNLRPYLLKIGVPIETSTAGYPGLGLSAGTEFSQGRTIFGFFHAAPGFLSDVGNSSLTCGTKEEIPRIASSILV